MVEDVVVVSKVVECGREEVALENVVEWVGVSSPVVVNVTWSVGADVEEVSIPVLGWPC